MLDGRLNGLSFYHTEISASLLSHFSSTSSTNFSLSTTSAKSAEILYDKLGRKQGSQPPLYEIWGERFEHIHSALFRRSVDLAK
jgi:hypothetical protein